MLNIDITAINLAIPVMAKEFSATLDTMQWVINAYLLLSAMLQILGGRLGDTYGHRKIFLIGTALFVISSVGAGAAPNETILIIFRTLQGLALGISYPMTIVLTFASFPKSQQGFALSFIIATMGVSLAIGPPLGGLFVHYIGWRWIFYINVPIGIIAYFLAHVFCPSSKSDQHRYIDYQGAFFLILGLFGIMLAINQVQQWGLKSIYFWSSFILGWVFLFALYFIEKKQSYPIINFNLFKIRNFLFNNIIRLIVQFVFIPVLFFTPIYLQNIAEFTALRTGLMLLFLTLVIGVLSPIAGKWVDRVGDKTPNILSMFLFALACLLFALLDQEPNIYLLGSALLLVGIATGISFVSTITGSVSVVSEDQQGVATGIIFTTAWFGCALGIALMGAILSLSSKHYLYNHMQHIKLSEQQFSILERASSGIYSVSNLSNYFSGGTLQKITAITVDSFMNGFHISMLVWMVLSLIGLIFACYLKKNKPYHHMEIPM
jgi:EmrB/QacA subfamily drug resistance transporter